MNFISEDIKSLVVSKLKNYTYEIIYIDNCSFGLMKQMIIELNAKDRNVKAISNRINFRFGKIYFYSLLQGTGGCIV